MKRLLPIGLGLVLLGLFSSLGQAEAPSWEGLVVYQGNEPFAVLVLVDQTGRPWRLEGDLVDELETQAQGLRVRVSGQIDGVDGIVVRTWTLVPGEKVR